MFWCELCVSARTRTLFKRATREGVERLFMLLILWVEMKAQPR